MVYLVPNSHYWTDIDMMITFFSGSGELDREYILVGLRNMKTLGYSIVKRRLTLKKRSQQQPTAKASRKPKLPNMDSKKPAHNIGSPKLLDELHGLIV